MQRGGPAVDVMSVLLLLLLLLDESQRGSLVSGGEALVVAGRRRLLRQVEGGAGGRVGTGVPDEGPLPVLGLVVGGGRTWLLRLLLMGQVRDVKRADFV